jgi:XTP/dITP diphosphohydrolase
VSAAGPVPERFVLATANPDKAAEIAEILAAAGVGIALTPRPTDVPDVVEDAATLEDNARLKAAALVAATGSPAIADDTGLEVDALGGAPGVHSAYYAGKGATRAERDPANNAKLLKSLESVADAQRTARFVCVLCIARPDGTILAESRGTFDGVIGHAPRGTNGFGYDPLLVLPDGRTSAELSSDEKNARSHRGNALRAILPKLRT